MLTSFTRFVPAYMGCGSLSRLGELSREAGLKTVLLVYDTFIKELGFADTAAMSLEKEGISVVHFPEIMPEPTDEIIEKGADAARKAKVDGIVGIGGGSSLDAAKCINILCANPSPISNYYVGPDTKPAKSALTLIMVPTTAGTGSECTISAVVSDTKNNRKAVIRSRECCLGAFTILDPELTAGMPKTLTSITGMDAFAHAAEAITIVPRNSNPVSEIFAKECIRLLTKYLPLAVKDGSDMKVREQVALASMISGYAFSNTLCHLGHALAHSLGAHLHLPHGACCGAVLPNVIEYVSDILPERVQVIGESMGLTFADDASPAEIGHRTAEAIQEFKKAIELPTLGDMGATREQAIEASKLVQSDGCFGLTPKDIDLEHIKSMLADIYDGKP